jgi:hypothetical protein
MAGVTQEDKYGNTNLAVWNLTSADPDGDKITRPGASDRAVQVAGTFGGATVVIQGSLNDGATWDTLHDPGGVAITFTSKGINAISENVTNIRAILSPVGSGANVNVYLLSRSTR